MARVPLPLPNAASNVQPVTLFRSFCLISVSHVLLVTQRVILSGERLLISWVFWYRFGITLSLTWSFSIILSLFRLKVVV